MNVRIIACLIAVLAMQVCAGPGDAPPKIGVIDTEKVMMASAAGKRALADLKQQQDKSAEQLRAQQIDLKALQDKINAGRASLPADELAKLTREYETRTAALQTAHENATRELAQKRDEALAAMDQKVMPTINQIGKELGFTLIFRKFESGLIYADDAVDMTNQVIQRLDAADAPAKK